MGEDCRQTVSLLVNLREKKICMKKSTNILVPIIPLLELKIVRIVEICEVYLYPFRVLIMQWWIRCHLFSVCRASACAKIRKCQLFKNTIYVITSGLLF